MNGLREAEHPRTTWAVMEELEGCSSWRRLDLQLFEPRGTIASEHQRCTSMCSAQIFFMRYNSAALLVILSDTEGYCLAIEGYKMVFWRSTEEHGGEMKGYGCRRYLEILPLYHHHY